MMNRDTVKRNNGRWRKCILLLSLFLLCCSPADDIYAPWAAYFTFNPVTSAPELYSALNNMGEFCTITTDGSNIVFATPHSSTPIRRTVIDQRVTLVLGLDGLIVGLPNIPEMGRDVSRVVCYELSCPNCYNERGISRRVKLLDSGIARCQRCTRQYDLNNLGIMSSDTTGISLYRYRVAYNQANNTLVVSN
ncbi:MAG: hypothetical protein K6F94_04970 [Bacteroidaceae bacterium]|nr:hypothetical protein [Bacteroidaceae bacterium]